MTFFARAVNAIDSQLEGLGGSEQIRSAYRARFSDYYRDHDALSKTRK